jgi:hypothetical protein
VLHEVTQTVSRATGALIYAVAIWDDGNGEAKIYEYELLHYNVLNLTLGLVQPVSA